MKFIYYETSVFLGFGVNEVFNNACRTALWHRWVTDGGGGGSGGGGGGGGGDINNLTDSSNKRRTCDLACFYLRNEANEISR